MAKKKSIKKNFQIHILIGILALSVLWLVSLMSSSQSIDNISKPEIQKTITPTPALKTYHSDFLKLTFKYPAEYEVEERFNTIILDAEFGQIKIDKLTTNQNNLNEFLKVFDSRRTMEVQIDQRLLIDGHDAAFRTHVFSNTIPSRKVYFIFISEGRVYAFSADDKILYNDLDQIARSFQYDP